MTAPEIKALEARLKAAGRRAAFGGERALPHVSFEDGMATIGVHFMKNARTTERMTIHGSIASRIEEQTLIENVFAMLAHRAERPEPRKEALKV